MRAPFVIRFETPDPKEARALAGALVRRMHEMDLPAELEPGRDVPICVQGRVGPHPVPVMRVALRRPVGPPNWLDPVTVPHEPEDATEAAVGFLERWGFIDRGPGMP